MTELPTTYHPYVRPTSGKATLALWLSILGLLTCGLSSIVGVVLGAVAYAETRDDRVAGKGQAISAIVVGLLLGLPVAVFAALLTAGMLTASAGS